MLGVADEVSLDCTVLSMYLSVENDELFNLIAGGPSIGRTALIYLHALSLFRWTYARTNK